MIGDVARRPEHERAARLWEAAKGPRHPRSPEYMRGVKATLDHLAEPVGRLHCPYTLGTAAADAWFAGNREAHKAWAHDTAPIDRDGAAP